MDNTGTGGFGNSYPYTIYPPQPQVCPTCHRCPTCGFVHPDTPTFTTITTGGTNDAPNNR